MLTKRKILAFSLLSLGVLGALFFNNNMNIIPYTIIYKTLSVIMAIAGIILLFTIPPAHKLRERQQLKQLIDSLKANGATLSIDLTQCTILEHSYTEARGARPVFEAMGFTELDNILPGDDNVTIDKTTQTKMENITLSILVYECEVNGAKQRFLSQVINKDRATLMFLIEEQQHTTLYYDRNNPAKCYFVLDFLDS